MYFAWYSSRSWTSSQTQTGKPPFNPRDAVRKFADTLKQYGISAVTGDRYAGETFVQDFQEQGVSYRLSVLTKSQIYEALEPRINAGEVELLDVSRLTEQLLGLVARGTKIDHLPGDHDDLANAGAGAVSLCVSVVPISPDSFCPGRDIARAARQRGAELVGAVPMTSTKKRLLILELVAAGQMRLDEARRRRAEILRRSRRGRMLLRIERAERIVGGAPQ